MDSVKQMQPFNWMASKTPEERREIAAKSHASRRRNKEAREAARREALAYAGGLREKIAALEKVHQLKSASVVLTGGALLSEAEIVAGSQPYCEKIGVYFLISEGRVVYVGQSTNVYARIGAHSFKKFDAFAVLPCPQHLLDKIESLYIHLLEPPENGRYCDGRMQAPIAAGFLRGIGL